MQTERDEMEYYGYTQKWVILCKNCKNHGTCRYEQHLGLDGYCSKAEERKNVLLEADLTSEQTAYLKGLAEGIKAAPVKHGYWKWNKQYGTECSECGTAMFEIVGRKFSASRPGYCPNCGARMDAQIGEDKSHPFAESVMMGMDEVEE